MNFLLDILAGDLLWLLWPCVGLLDAFTEKNQETTQIYTQTSDSYNRAFSSSSVQDNVGNTSLNLGGGGETNLPLILGGLGLLAVGAMLLMR